MKAGGGLAMILLCCTLWPALTVTRAQQVASLYSQAADFIQNGQPGKAIALIEPHVQSAPRDIRALTLLGMALSADSQSEQARGWLLRALDVDPRYVPALRGLAIEEAHTRDFDSARKRLDLLLSLSPSDPVAHFTMAQIEFNARNFSSAAAHYEQSGDIALRDPANMILAYVHAGRAADAVKKGEQLVSKGYKSAELYNVLAQAYESSGKTKEAYEALRTASSIAPTDPVNYLDLIALCITHRNYDLALEIADISLKRAADSDQLHLQRGIVLAMKEQFADAQAAFETAMKLAPEKSAPPVALALIQMQMDRAPDAVSLLRSRVRAGHEDYLVLWFLGEALSRSGAAPQSEEAHEAIEALTRSVAFEPSAPQPRVLLAKLLAANGNLDGAATHLTRALELDPGNTSATYQLAQIWQRKGDAVRARQLFAKVSQAKAEEREQFTRGGIQHLIRLQDSAEKSPADEDYRRGLAFDRSGQTDNAIASFEQALRRKPDMTLARYQLAGCCRKRGDFEGELRLLEAVVRRLPEFAEARLNFGLALQRAQRGVEAIDQLRAAVRLAPKDPRSLLALGTALSESDPNEATRFLKQAVEVKPDLNEGRYNLALALAKAGDNAGAIAEFEAVIKLNSEHTGAHRGLGLTLMHEEKLEQALHHVQRAVALSATDAEAWNNLGLVYMRRLAFAEAINAFQRATAANPSLIKAHFNLAQALTRAGRSDEAQRANQRGAELTEQQRGLGRAMILVQAAHQEVTAGNSIAKLREAIKESTSLADAHAELAKAIVASGGDLNEAVREWRQVLNLDPERAEAHFGIGLALLKSDKAVAADEFSAASQMAPCRVEVMRALGRLALERSDFETAIRELNRTLAWDPTDSESRKLLEQAMKLMPASPSSTPHNADR